MRASDEHPAGEGPDPNAQPREDPIAPPDDLPEDDFGAEDDVSAVGGGGTDALAELGRRIPRPAIRRLSLYLRELDARAADEPRTISSRVLAQALGLTDAQVRKDLTLLGQIGQSGVGYGFEELRDRLREVLGSDLRWTCVVVGAGNIGRAVVAYARLADRGFHVADIFDTDPRVVGTLLAGRMVRPVEELEQRIAAVGAELALIAVPAEAARDIARRAVGAGVRGLLNFAPIHLDVDDRVPIVTVDLTSALQQLSFLVRLDAAGTSDSFE